MVEPGGLAGVVADPVALAAAIQQAVVTVPGVVRISPGRNFVDATYGPGMTVQGVGMGVYTGRLEVSVHIVTGPTSIPSLAQRLRRVIGSIIHEHAGRAADTIDLYIDDIVLDTGPGGDGAA
ncbi:MAG: hypothetical protein NVS4B2_33260 [Chloroflexota bacterium]